MQITITENKISPATLKQLCEHGFGDMVKLGVDVEQEIIAIGGELHADAESLLIEHGSRQENIWGANFYPWNVPEHRIDYTALINIRPHQNNPSLEILDEQIKQAVKNIIEILVLSPDEQLV